MYLHTSEDICDEGKDYLQSGCKLKGKKINKTEIQPGFEPRSSKLQLDALITQLLELWHWSRDVIQLWLALRSIGFTVL